ncbi:MAG: SIS domain-containing protein, partial [Candidatus Omnitrophica bacterium]|nr:SIS domain-containing protein [Candidatus Omnitrophota bacterium]
RDPPSTAKTTIFSPTVNHLLSLEEADSVLPDEELSQLSNLYNKMTQNEREALDRYLKDIWELDEGFNTLLHGKKKRKEWVRYLADWRVDSRYYIYMYNQKTKIPWDADFSGLGHKKLIDILDKAFNGQLSINVENFLSNLKTALIDINCADLATLVDNRGLNLQAHLFRIADESGRLHKHQAKILFKVLRVLVAAQADFKSMRHNLTHGARPFLNIILRNTGFAEEAKQGMIFVDEVTNGGENILYLEIVCKAFNPGFQYRFLDLSQIHPELSKLYLGLGIVDDVLAPQALHPLEDFPEMAEEQYTLDAESPTLQKFRYKTVLEELKASVAKRGRDLQQVIGERDLEIDKVLSDQPLRALLTEMQNLESYRKVANFDIGRELVKNYIRVKGNGANFIDGLVFPNVFFCGIAGFSNREYEVLDKEWDLITKFRTRLSELENEKHDLVVKINYLDNEAKIADYISYLSLWCDWYERTLSEIKDTKKEIIARADTIREFMEGRIDNGSLVRELMESAYDSKDKEYLPFGDFVQRYTGEYIGLLGKQSDKESLAMLVKLASLIIESHRKGGRLFIIGNGEGAAIASHMTADFGKGVAVQGSQGRLSAVSLSSLPWISALANDVSFASIYEEQLKNHNLGENDIIIAVEGSQKLSSEIRNALKYAAKVGSKKILLAAASLNAPDVSCADMAIQIKSGTRS